MVLRLPGDERDIKPGLERIERACEVLGHPERQFKSIHIAGTNGKGSTAAFLESILRNSGYTVGLYTSPHLTDVRERIQIGRKWISADEIAELCTVVHEKCCDMGLSYFEFLTALALLYFSSKKVDIAIMETGLGGRWDATNVIQPLLTIITPISVDHTSFLGEGLISIAGEKCGVIKPGVPVVVARQHPDVGDLIQKVCAERGAKLVVCGEDREVVKLFLPGDYQVINASLAIRAAEELCSGRPLLRLRSGQAGHYGYLKDVSWPGRLQTISKDPEIILDGAHNPEACRALSRYIGRNYRGRDVVIIFGAMADKDLHGMTRHVKEIASAWVILPLDGKRAAKASDLKDVIGTENVVTATDTGDAVHRALEFGFKNPLIVVCGSLYLVGKFLIHLCISKLGSRRL